MAKQLAVAPQTILQAYQGLERDGLVVSHRGRGTVVAALEVDAVRPAMLRNVLAAPIREAHQRGFSLDEIQREIRQLYQQAAATDIHVCVVDRIRFQNSVQTAVLDDPALDLFQSANPYNITIGADCFPAVGREDYRAQIGDIVKFDIGATVGGYSSDLGRTYVIDRPDALQQKIHAALQAGQEAALEALRPGTPMSAVSEAAHDAVRRHGFPAYTRDMSDTTWGSRWGGAPVSRCK